jgi:hypothetical protein
VPSWRKQCQVLSIVGDGRCPLYSLLRTERAMLSTWYEADELRQQLRAHVLSYYTDEQWSARVPGHMREIYNRQRFAEMYLAHPTTHLPHDSIALWQDMHQSNTDVYILCSAASAPFTSTRYLRAARRVLCCSSLPGTTTSGNMSS